MNGFPFPLHVCFRFLAGYSMGLGHTKTWIFLPGRPGFHMGTAQYTACRAVCGQVGKDCRDFLRNTTHLPLPCACLSPPWLYKVPQHTVWLQPWRALIFPLGVAQGQTVSETGKRETGWKAVKESQTFCCFQLPPRCVYGPAEESSSPSSCCPPAQAVQMFSAVRALLSHCQTNPSASFCGRVAVRSPLSCH